MDLAASVGSTGVSAPAPTELVSTDSTTASVTNVTQGIPLYGIILASIAGTLIAGGFVFSVLRAFKASGLTPIAKIPIAEIQGGRVVQVVYLSNPLDAKSSTRRMDFVPMKVIGARKS